MENNYSNTICNISNSNKNSVATCIPLSKYSLNVDYMKADTGASSTFLKEQHYKYLDNSRQILNGPIVHLPNNNTLTPNLQGTLTLNDSPPIKSYILPGMTNASLLSVGQLCDSGCIAMFTKNDLQVFLTKNF